jgi:transposase InsO family protein
VSRILELRRDQPAIGGRKLYSVLTAERLIAFGRDAFFAFLRKRQLLVRRKASAPITTYAGEMKHPNLVGKRKPSRPGQVVVSDITYIRTIRGFIYLALVTDLCRRRIIGYHVSESLKSNLCVRAMQKALAVLGPLKECLIHHSDRGVQYSSKVYQDLLRQNHVYCSMTERMHCAENAVAERINGILKHELMLKATFKHTDDARDAIAQAIRTYNRRRPHLALGYATPDQYYRIMLN